MANIFQTLLRSRMHRTVANLGIRKTQVTAILRGIACGAVFLLSAVPIYTAPAFAQPSSAFSPQKTIGGPSTVSVTSSNPVPAAQAPPPSATNDLNNLSGKRPSKVIPIDVPPKSSSVDQLQGEQSGQATGATQDNLRVNKLTAVKEKLAQQIHLPGVRKLNANEVATLDFSRAQLIGVNELGSKTAYIAIGEYNRLELPFLVNYAHTVYDKNKIAVERSESKSANSLYITTLAQQGTTLYLETTDGKAIAINLSPKKDIPAQTIVVQNTTEASPFSEKALSTDGNSQEAKWTNALTVAAAGKVPQGFSDSQFTSGLYQKNELKIRPVRVLSSANMDIFDYEISSAKDVTTKVEEDDLDLKSAQAHTFFPSNVIEPGKTVHALVLIKRY